MLKNDAYKTKKNFSKNLKIKLFNVTILDNGSI